jgi:putative nucleotidyltransferase with HDIG domain
LEGGVNTKADEARATAVIVELIPELDLIQDGERRAAVVEVWRRAWLQSSHDDLALAPFASEAPDESLVEHMRAATQGANALADILTNLHNVEVDRDRLLCAALLHDVSRLLEVGPDGAPTSDARHLPHAYLGAELARQAGLSEDIVSLVIGHTPQIKMNSPYIIEAIILEHADLASAYILLARVNDA